MKEKSKVANEWKAFKILLNAAFLYLQSLRVGPEQQKPTNNLETVNQGSKKR